ncbi:MAG: hypothetical protein AAGF01_11120, partial [Cyanobacteria bacterium P01_G01_bin.38]
GYLTVIVILIVLSIVNISLKSDEIRSDIWSFSIDIKVTSITLLLIFILWLPILLPWLISLFPQLQGSLNWLRRQGIEEVETNLLRIKLRYGVEEASKNYEEEIWEPGATSATLTSRETHEQIERRYRDAITLVDTASNIDSVEALRRIDQLANYYDKVRYEMPSGSNRTRLMREISSIMWALVPKTVSFPVRERLMSAKAGKRLSAYKYIEWQPSAKHINLLLSRAVGVLEMPFGQYSALLALRRVIANNQLTPNQLKEISSILNWSGELDYIKSSQGRSGLTKEILSILR